MSCPHKFQEYLNLKKGYLNADLNNLDFDPVTLIVGTFNPAWPDSNNAQWFYGRTRNNYFWDVVPRLFGDIRNLRKGTNRNPETWKRFCHDHQIALTDIIYSIYDANPLNDEHKIILRSYLDSSIVDYFESFSFVDLCDILDEFQSIKNIYLTRQAGIPLFDQRWDLVEQYAVLNPGRNLHVRKLLTPSASARFQIQDYRARHPQNPTPLRNFIFEQWGENWHVM
jgi:hypothetical protein